MGYMKRLNAGGRYRARIPGPASTVVELTLNLENVDFGGMLAKVHKANIRNLFKAAGLIRTTAARSIKHAPKRHIYRQKHDEKGRFTPKATSHSIDRGKQVSKPGKPPFSHTGPLRNLMKFDVNDRNETAVIGPMVFPSASGHDVPKILEEGGAASNLKGQRYIMKPRPYMQPAETKARGKYPQFWRDSVR